MLSGKIFHIKIAYLWILGIVFCLLLVLSVWMVWTDARITLVGKGADVSLCTSSIDDEPVILGFDDVFVFKTYDGSVGALRFNSAYQGLADGRVNLFL